MSRVFTCGLMSSQDAGLSVLNWDRPWHNYMYE